MADIQPARRDTGIFTGALLALLGAWGALIPYLGPYFHYAYTPGRALDFTAGRFWMEALPGVGAFLGGLIVLLSHRRPIGHLGAWLAAASGAWFVVGGVLAPLWPGHWSAIGDPVGAMTSRVAEQIGYFPGLGVLIVLLAGIAIGRLTRAPAKTVAAVTAAGPASTAGTTPPTTAPAPAPAPAGLVAVARRAPKPAAAPGPGRGPFTGLFRSRQRSAGSKAA